VPSSDATDLCSFSFSYDPDKQADPADPNKWMIQRGTSVTIDISCPTPEVTDDTVAPPDVTDEPTDTPEEPTDTPTDVPTDTPTDEATG
jgi:hypothetical protein